MIAANPNPSILARRRKAAFTLVEMLAVLAIVGLLAAAVFSAPGLLRSNNLTTAGNVVRDEVAFARELAVAGNSPTEVWFLRPTGGTFLTALQTYTVDQNGAATSYGGVHHLPPNIGMDTGTYLSPFVVSGNKKQWVSPQVQPAIAGYQTSYDAWVVRFMPDGSTTLPTSSLWYLSLHDIPLGDQLSALPKNFVSISIDPVTGAVSLYRP